jgi:hypothetical protein
MASKIERILACDAGACSEGPPARPFEWDARKQLAAALLARGALTKRRVAGRAGVDEMTLYRWRLHPEFAAEVARLTRETGLALRNERLLALKRCGEAIAGELESRFAIPQHLGQYDTLKLVKMLLDLARGMNRLDEAPAPPVPEARDEIDELFADIDDLEGEELEEREKKIARKLEEQEFILTKIPLMQAEVRRLMNEASSGDESCDDDCDDYNSAGDADGAGGAGSVSPGLNLEAGITADGK